VRDGIAQEGEHFGLRIVGGHAGTPAMHAIAPPRP
jgi:hypothetical protein